MPLIFALLLVLLPMTASAGVGRSMADAHRGMRLSAKDWDRTVDFLSATMNEFKVAPELQNEVVTLVGSTRGSIVECEADKFGCR